MYFWEYNALRKVRFCTFFLKNKADAALTGAVNPIFPTEVIKEGPEELSISLAVLLFSSVLLYFFLLRTLFVTGSVIPHVRRSEE